VTVDHWLTPSFGERFLFQIAVTEVERYKQERLLTVSPSTVNKELNCLKAMLNKAITWGYLKENPLKGMLGLKEPAGRLRYLALEEAARLLTACEAPPYLLPIVEFAMHTGMRRSEILALRWSDVDLRRRTLTLTQTKNNERRIIPVRRAVLAGTRS
jgi:integrase